MEQREEKTSLLGLSRVVKEQGNPNTPIKNHPVLFFYKRTGCNYFFGGDGLQSITLPGRGRQLYWLAITSP